MSCPHPTFLGDVDGDGFGDFGCIGIASLTGYQYFFNFGVSYSFGSILNNIVNPRFGGGGGF